MLVECTNRTLKYEYIINAKELKGSEVPNNILKVKFAKWMSLSNLGQVQLTN